MPRIRKSYVVPRRQSARWLDGDCPRDVLAIFDDRSGGEQFTVFYRHVYSHGRQHTLFGRGMSAHPCHPQGIGMSLEMQLHEVRAYRDRNSHRKARFSELPDDVRRLIIADCKPGGLGSADDEIDTADQLALQLDGVAA